MSIFSTYSTGENRVTASLLAVLRSLSLDRIQRLLGAILEQSEFERVRFENQPSKGGIGVPDAIIHASIRLLVETKIERNATNTLQITRHLERLDAASETTTEQRRDEGEHYKVMLLSAPDSPDTLRLPGPIPCN